MIRRWLAFFLELLIFAVLLISLVFLTLQPHMRRSFTTVIENRLGLKVEVGEFHFSPTGWMEGRNLRLYEPSGGRAFAFTVESLSLEPIEPLYLSLLRNDFKLTLQQVQYRLNANELYFHWVDLDIRARLSYMKIEQKDRHLNILLHNLSSTGLGSSLSVKRAFLSLEHEGANLRRTDWLKSIQELNISAAHLVGAKEFRLHTLELHRQDQEWFGAVLGQAGDFPIQALPRLRWLDSQRFSFELDSILLPGGEKLRAEIQGPTSIFGPWSAEIGDNDLNRLVAEFNIVSRSHIFGSWQFDMQSFRPPGLEGEALRGYVSGGFRWEDGRFKGDTSGHDLSGGPRGTSGLNFKALLGWADGQFEIEEFRGYEEDRWRATLSAVFSLPDFTPRKLNLDIADFPLTQYSPHVSGSLDVKAVLADDGLKISAKSDELLPGKDPLQKLENFAVNILVTTDAMKYRQTALRANSENTVDVVVAVDHLLVEPLRPKAGVLKRMRVFSSFFDLHLVQPTPIQLNALEADVPAFHLEDKAGKLSQIRGKAHIPFVNPRDLRIELGGILDLGRFPSIANSPARGQVRMRNGLWDKGWSIANLRTDLEADNLELDPGAVFPALRKISIAGRFEDKKIMLKHISGSGANGVEVTASGNYDIFENTLELLLSADNLSYESPDTYAITYQLPALEVKGPAHALNIAGPVLIQDFRYLKPFELFERGKNTRRRTMSSTLGSFSVQHTLDLSIHNPRPLRFVNNAADFEFTIPNLAVRGAFLSPAWNGTITTTTNPTNTVTVPITPIELNFKVSKLRLKFVEDTEWNPAVILEAQKEKNDVVITLTLDQRLNELSQKDVQLTSRPSLPKVEILRRLMGEESSRTQFLNIQDDDEDLSVESSMPTLRDPLPILPIRDITVLGDEEGDIGVQKRFRLTDRLSFNLSSLDIGLDYQLIRSLGLEISQKSEEEEVFFGFKFSKRFATLRNLFEKADRFADDRQEEHRIVWDLQGLPSSWGLGSNRLELELASIDASLKQGRYDLARGSVTSTLKRHLHRLGYADARWSSFSIEHGYDFWARRKGSRHHSFTQTTIFSKIETGPRYVLDEVEIVGWPAAIAKPDDLWLGTSRGRPMLYNVDRVEEFHLKLLGQLSESGYPAAQIVQTSIFGAYAPLPHPVVPGGLVYADNSVRRYRKLGADDKALRLVVGIDAGPPMTVEQLVIRGVEGERALLLKEYIGYRDSRIYSETDLQNYRSGILKWYEEQHYLGTQVVLYVLRSTLYPRCSLHVDVREGSRWRVRNILFEGIVLTKQTFLENRIPLKSGDWITQQKLNRCREALNALEIFESIDHEILETDNPETRDIRYRLRESAYLSTAIKIGYESSEGLQGSWRGRVENVAGAGRFATMEGSFNSRESLKRLSFTDPFFLNRNWVGEVSLAQKVEILSARDIRNESYRLKFGLSYKWTETLQQILALIVQEDRSNRDQLLSFIDQKSHVPSLRLRLSTHQLTSSFSQAPQPGFQSQAKMTLVSYFLKSGTHAYLGDYTLSYGLKLGKALIVPWHRWGHTALVGGRRFDIPLADRSFLGGSNSLRGFSKDEISGPEGIGGESLSVAGVQWLYPLFAQLDGSIFYEAGDVYSGHSHWSLNDLNDALGFGLLVRTPVGPLQFTYGHAIGRKTGRFGIQLGTAF